MMVFSTVLTIGALVFVVTVAIFVFILRSNYFDSQVASYANLKRPLERLLKSGYDGGYVDVIPAQSRLSIQFLKYIHLKGDCGLELVVLDNPNLREYFSQIEKHCEERGYVWKHVNETEGSRIIIDCGSDLDQALDIGEGIITKIFHLSLDIKYTYRFFGISRWNESIDSPDHKPLSYKEGRDLQDKQLRRKLGISRSNVTPMVWLSFAQFFGILGLLVRFFFVDQNWLSMKFYVSDIMFQVPIFDLIFISLILVGMTRVCTRFFWWARMGKADPSVPRYAGHPTGLAMIRALGNPLDIFCFILIFLAIFYWIE